jgi:hypothetical protein
MCGRGQRIVGYTLRKHVGGGFYRRESSKFLVFEVASSETMNS